ncbi:MAG: metal ABC transporter permease [Erysipelothrix sp.]|nr:metal ABC transporter permease [Erysipelothrix sp.]
MSIINELLNALSYTFVVRALLVGSLIGFSAAFLGVYLVILRQSMIGDGLAHVSFLTIAIALLLGQSTLLVSIPIVTLASVLIMHFDDKYHINNDSAIGLISAMATALAILIASINNGFSVDLYSYLFGSILVINDLDMILSLVLAVSVVIIIVYNYNSLLIMSFDPDYAHVIGINVKRMKMLIATLTAITVVLGIRVVGTMLISSMILFPTISAMQVAKNFKTTITYASIISVGSIIIGVFASFLLDIPTGSTIVIINGIIFGILLMRKLRYA